MSGEHPVGTPLSTQHSAPITVLFLAGEYPPRPGGVGDYTALLAQHLADQDIRVAVLATRDTPALSPADPRSSGRAILEASRPDPRDARYWKRPAPTPGTRDTGSVPPLVWRAVRRWDWRCAPS